MRKEIYEETNKALIKEFLYIPPYDMRAIEISEFYAHIKQDNIKAVKGSIIQKVSLPWRRAYQMVYRYKELGIFTQEALHTIDFATIAFLEGNVVCAYLSLIPVIETLIMEWAKQTIPTKKLKKYNT